MWLWGPTSKSLLQSNPTHSSRALSSCSRIPRIAFLHFRSLRSSRGPQTFRSFRYSRIWSNYRISNCIVRAAQHQLTSSLVSGASFHLSWSSTISAAAPSTSRYSCTLSMISYWRQKSWQWKLLHGPEWTWLRPLSCAQTARLLRSLRPCSSSLSCQAEAFAWNPAW